MAPKHKGKKVFTHAVKLPTGEVSVDIRVSPHGWFSAEIGLDSIEDKDIDAVRRWIEETVKRSKTLEFTPWIEIKSPESRRHYGRSRDNGTERDAELSVSFKVLLLSTEMFSDNKPNWQGHVKRFRLSRACKLTKKLEVVADTGVAEDRQDAQRAVDDEDIPDRAGATRGERLVPYTPQRYQALVSLLDNIEAARKQFDDMLVQSENGAKLLDRAAFGPLLLAIEAKGK